MNSAQTCNFLKNNSSLWYVTKSIFQIVAYIMIFVLVNQINKKGDLELTRLRDRVDKLKGESAGQQTQTAQLINQLIYDYETQRKKRKSYQNRVKEILIIVGVLKLMSFGRYFFHRMNLYRQCMTQVGMYSQSHAGAPQARRY